MTDYTFAIKHGFSGAVIFEATLDASLINADVSVQLGAAVRAALQSGAYLRGTKVKRMIASASRISDPHQFFAWEREDGGVWITAGCRAMSLADYREHVSEEYPSTTKAEETLDILDYFETRAQKMGVAEANETEKKS